MMPLGHTWISHPADNGFPSDHGLVMFSAAFALLSLRLRSLGLFVLLASLPVAWSRIFLGVHFPLDMVGAAAVAVVAVWVSKGVWQAFGPAMVRICEAISQRMFSGCRPVLRRSSRLVSCPRGASVERAARDAQSLRRFTDITVIRR